MEPKVQKIPGFTQLNLIDNLTFFLLVGSLLTKGFEFILELTLSKRAPNGSEFLISSVKDVNRVILWNFQDFRDQSFKGLCRLVFVEKIDEHVIAFCTFEGIERVIPIIDLPKIKRVTIGDKVILVGGRNPKDALRVKIETAKQLKMKFIMSEEEQSLHAALRQYDEEQKEFRKAQAAEERQKRIEAILTRPTIFSFTEEGKKVFGIPVLESEWMSLPSGKAVILVDSFDESGQPGKMVEAFFVKKIGASCSKNSLRVVGFEPKKATTSSTPATEIKGFLNFIINGGPEQVLIVESKSVLESLRSAGLNSGTLVAVGKTDSEGRYAVLSLKGKKTETVGHFKPMA